jgi:O-antigen/teichoic acid export membrane protein
MEDIKSKALHGGLIRIIAQLAIFVLRFGSLMALARLLTPGDFGLVAMVAALAGILNLLRDFGLSTAMVQRPTVTSELISALFWTNMLVAALSVALIMTLSPLIVSFYKEPRLQAITIALATGFLFNAAGVQHIAILEREMRFSRLALIDMASVAIGSALAITVAWQSGGYWSLVLMMVVVPLASTVFAWSSTGWIPGRPNRGVGVRQMIHFGATTTLNGLVVYVAYNLDKVLLGRYWGAEALGIYGRGYQLANIPIENLNSAVGGVALSALSRLQDDPERFRTYFLRGYSLLLSLTIPIALAFGLLADDIVAVVLGRNWGEVGPILRMLAPTVIVFALINPLGWFMFALGLVRRSLTIALLLAPLVICGYLIGLPHGPIGVAACFSITMVLWVVPHILLCVRKTMVSPKDILLAAGKPMLAGLIAGGVVLAMQALNIALPPIASLGLWGSVLTIVHFGVLIFFMGEREFYTNLVRGTLEPFIGRQAR